MNSGQTVLWEIRRAQKAFAGRRVLDECSLTVRSGEIVGLHGHNGCGKTTLLNAATRMFDLDQGELCLLGRAYGDLPMHKVIDLGIRRSFQAPRTWQSLSIRDNLLISPQQPWRESITAGLFARNRVDRAERDLVAIALPLLEGLIADESGRLDPNLSQPVTGMSPGQRRAIELARVIGSGGTMIFLDEPSAGLDQSAVGFLSKAIKASATHGTGFLVVSHDPTFLAEVADRTITLRGNN